MPIKTALAKGPDADLPAFPRTHRTFRLGPLLGRGVEQVLEHGDISTLTQRIRRFFATSDSAARVVGAIPFDRAKQDYLFQPSAFSREPRAKPATSSGEGLQWRLTGQPSAGEYRAAVAACLDLIRQSVEDAEPLQKVVLSRSLSATAPYGIDPVRLLSALARDESITAFATMLPGSTPQKPRMLLGATPELLVSKAGNLAVSHPLAGSARRNADAALDRQSGEKLLQSEKDQREHRAVVEAVMDTLAPYCTDLGAPDGTTLRATASMWHLGTRIAGVLKDRDTPVVELVSVLHPTPAVCGLPRQRSAEVIRQLEGYDRGFYAGAVGYSDRAGDGEWYVSIRCAEIDGPNVRLYAGAGIVEGSDPAGETDETSAKFVALLSALGIDEQGHPLRGVAA